jgi:hypothetical protein
MPKNIKNTGAPDLKLDSARSYVPVLKGADDLPDGTCRGLLVGTAGTANLTEDDGTERNGVPLIAGYNFLVVKKVRTGGTADNIWALY